MTVRVGFYGAGFITRYHTAQMERSGVDHAIVAVHDPDAERAAAFAARHGAEVVGEDELVEGVDAVYVCTWTTEHARLVDESRRQGARLSVFEPRSGERFAWRRSPGSPPGADGR